MYNVLGTDLSSLTFYSFLVFYTIIILFIILFIYLFIVWFIIFWPCYLFISILQPDVECFGEQFWLAHRKASAYS